MTLDELDRELARKYGGYISISTKTDTDIITIDGWYSLEELEGIVADIKQWQGQQHEPG